MSRGQLIVFAKAPRPGLVKTRLSPPLDLDQAATLYSAMLADVLETSASFVREKSITGVLAVYPVDAIGDMISQVPVGFRLQAQLGEGLAARMANAFAEAFAEGAPWVLLRGSDSPALHHGHFAEAISRLESGDDVVVTPDQGGGYAMIGMKSPHSLLFEIPMSTSEMRSQTIELARTAGLRCSSTEITFDLDTPADLARLDMMADSNSSDSCRRTVQVIEQLRSDLVL